MKIKKDATSDNVLLLDADDVVQAAFTAGQYSLRLSVGGVSIWGVGEALTIAVEDVSHTITGGVATAFTGDSADLMDYLANTAFAFGA